MSSESNSNCGSSSNSINDDDSDSVLDEPVGPSGLELSLTCQYEHSPQILIVDDNVFNILALETILISKDVGITERALNGQEAVNLV